MALGLLGAGVADHAALTLLAQSAQDFCPVCTVFLGLKNRKEAVPRMECVLGEFSVEGLVTNVPFHLLVMRNRRFLSGEYTTRCARQLFSQLLREGLLEELKVFQLPWEG